MIEGDGGMTGETLKTLIDDYIAFESRAKTIHRIPKAGPRLFDI